MDLNFKELSVNKEGDFNLIDGIESLQQSQDIVLKSNRGNIINRLDVGVGIFKFLHSPLINSKMTLNRVVRDDFSKVGIDVKSINVVDGEIFIVSKSKR